MHTAAIGIPRARTDARTAKHGKWWTLAAVCTGVFMLLLDLTIVNVALPDIEHAFKASLADLQWVISAYALTLAAFLLTGGSLADLYGRRLLFAIGIIIFTTGSLLCGVATSSLFLTLSRGGQGIGGAIMFATSLALLAQAFQGRERGVALGLFGAITGVAIAIGPVLGGAITSGLSWRWIFYVNIPIGIAALLMTLSRVDESRNPTATRPDWAGFLTFSAGLAGLVYGLITSQRDGWGATSVIASLAASAALLSAFVTLERLRGEPMLDLGLLRVPTFDGGLIAAFAISASILSVITYLIVFLQNSLGLSAVATGVRFLPLTGAIFLTSPLAGRLTSQVPRRLLISAGFVLVGVGLLLMRGLTPSSSWTHLLAGMIVSGVGTGLVSTPLVSTAVGVVAPARAGMASGINSTLRQVGVATGVAALGTILASTVRSSVLAGLGGTALAGHAHTIAHAVATGSAAQAIATTPAPLRGLVAAIAHSALVDGLNTILLVSAIVALAAAAGSWALIRERDFTTTAEADDHHPGSGSTRGRRRHRVIVVGGGFAGLQAVRGLRRAPVEVTLVDRQNFTLFQPLVYQVATGVLSPAEIAVPLRAILRRQRNTRVLLAEVTGFDLQRRRIELARLPTGERRSELGYDTLIVAGGSRYSYFGHDEWQTHAPEPKSLVGALEIRGRILAAFEAAEAEPDPERRRAWLTFVVVGAGPTGVEIAGQIAELANDTLRPDFRRADTGTARVLLVEAADRVLPTFPQSLSMKAARALRQLGVTVHAGHLVVGVSDEGVAIETPGSELDHVAARTAIWAAGVTASDLAARLAQAAGREVDRAGRLTVGPDLSVPAHPEVLALGDMVRVQAGNGEAVALPGLAPVAMQEGRYAARAVRDRLRGRATSRFRYHDKGNLATIGRSRAVADIKGLHLAGFVAWAIWLIVHLFYLIGFQNRLLVIVRLTVAFFSRRRGARLILDGPEQAKPDRERPVNQSPPALIR